MDEKHFQYLQREYIALWKGFGVDIQPEDRTLKMTHTETGTAKKKAQTKKPTLEGVRKALGNGCGCTLCPSRKNLVFGSGNPTATLMFVGEGPGADEDEQGLPFVGRCGQLLTKIIEAMNLKREDVYIANVVKCRPPQNRVPTPEEISICSPFLRQQIEAVAPEMIVALGATASLTLVSGHKQLAPIRGKLQKLTWNESIQVMPTYHPAYLLRNPPAKKIVWDDMKIVMGQLGAK